MRELDQYGWKNQNEQKEWRIENGLVQRSESDDFGFPENKVENLRSDPRALQGEKRFTSLALRAIETFKSQLPEEEAA